MSENESSKKFSPLFKTVFVIFGAITLLITFQILKIWQIRHTWPRVTGEVVKISSRGWWDEAAQQRFYLTYQYQVNKKTFTGSRFHIKDGSIKRFTHLIRHYKPGDPISVWYQPDDPSVAVINTEYLRDSFGLIMVFTGFLFLAGTMIFKENAWEKQVRNLTASLPEGYRGGKPLPGSGILRDDGKTLTLDTGMSIYWARGVPFLIICFVALLPFVLFLDEINPGWSLACYLSIVGGAGAAGVIAGGLVSAGFKKTLVVDAALKTVTETSRTLFSNTVSAVRFSDVRELKLHRDQWHVTNTLKNWILYLHTRENRSIFVCFRHRDRQPAHQAYLSLLKTRMETLIFGGADAPGR